MKRYFIKSDVDLNILKQFPFEVEDSFSFSHTNADASKHFQVWKSNREIRFLNGSYPFGEKLLKMLVKAGLVEERSE